MKNKTEQLSLNEDFLQLKKAIDEKYVINFCDVFEQAKAKLLSDSQTILGAEYEAYRSEMEKLREDIKNTAKTLNESQNLCELKDQLTLIKERLIKAQTPEEKQAIKAEMQATLTEITKLNLSNFMLLSDKRKQLNAVAEQMQKLIDSKKELFGDVEKAVTVETKEKLNQLVFAYKTEVETLAKAFDIKNYVAEPPLLNKLNPNAKLIEFDKQTILNSLSDEERNHSDKHGERQCFLDNKCDGNCSACNTKGDEEPKIYTVGGVDKTKN